MAINKLDPTIMRLVKSIRSVESGGNYEARGASGEVGAFQFMPSTWKLWSKEFLGIEDAEMTKENQNKVAYLKIKSLADRGFTPTQSAAAWNGGEGVIADNKWKTMIGTNKQGVSYNIPKYVNSVMSRAREASKDYAIEQDIYSLKGKSPEEQKSLIKKIGAALISSEVSLGEDIAATLTTILPKSWTGEAQLEEIARVRDESFTMALKGLKAAQERGSNQYKWYKLIGGVLDQDVQGIEDLYPAMKKSNLQITGDVAGTLLDIVTFGTYGTAMKGVKAGSLLVKGGTTVAKLAPKIGIPVIEKVVAPVTKEAVKNIVKLSLKDYAKETSKLAIKRATIGGSIGYGYDVTEGLKAGETGFEALKPGFGAILGTVFPVGIGASKLVLKTGSKITTNLAPKLINSLVKPKTALFSYGKNPGKAVSELGIIGKNMDDFAINIGIKKNEIGEQISRVYSNPANSGNRINVGNIVKVLEKRISESAEGGINQQNVVKTLANIKDALLWHFEIVDGKIVKTSQRWGAAAIRSAMEGDLDLAAPGFYKKINFTPDELFAFKKIVSSHTQFTGRVSDDKFVNQTLQDVYKNLTKKLNKAVEKNNPEIRKLNELYGNLTSAEIATINRDAIVKRADFIGLKTQIGAGGLGIGTILAGGNEAAVLATLLSAGGIAVGKAFDSPIVRTHIASWLGKTHSSVIKKIVTENPEVALVLYRYFPLKMAAQIKAEFTEE